MAFPVPSHGPTVADRGCGPRQKLMDPQGGKKLERREAKGKQSTYTNRHETRSMTLPPMKIGAGRGQRKPRVVSQRDLDDPRREALDQPGGGDARRTPTGPAGLRLGRVGRPSHVLKKDRVREGLGTSEIRVSGRAELPAGRRGGVV